MSKPDAPLFTIMRWLTLGEGRALPDHVKWTAATIAHVLNRETRQWQISAEELAERTGRSRAALFRALQVLCAPGGPFVRLRHDEVSTEKKTKRRSNWYRLDDDALSRPTGETVDSGPPPSHERDGTSPTDETVDRLTSSTHNRPGTTDPPDPIGGPPGGPLQPAHPPDGRPKGYWTAERMAPFVAVWKKRYGDQSVAPVSQLRKELRRPETANVSDEALLSRWNWFTADRLEARYARPALFLQELGSWDFADSMPVKTNGTATAAPTATATAAPIEVEAVVVEPPVFALLRGPAPAEPLQAQQKADRHRQRGDALVREFANYMDRLVPELRAPWPAQAIQRWRSETGTDERETQVHEVLRRALELVTEWRAQRGGAMAGGAGA